MGKNGKAPTNTVKAFAGAKNGIAPIISELPQLQQRRRRSHRPWGCCPCRSGPSSLRERGRRKNQRTVRRHGHGRGYRSGHRKRDLQRRCRDAGYDRYHRRKQRRSFNLAWNFDLCSVLIIKIYSSSNSIANFFPRFFINGYIRNCSVFVILKSI